MIYFEKSQPAPICLEQEKNYRCSGVLQQLRVDFKNKCYICESKRITTLNVEHFKAHRGDNLLKLDWNNLFWSCGHCNNTKELKSEYDNILNCTKVNDAIEDKINHRYPGAAPFAFVEISVNDKSEKTINTQALLLAIYNGATPLKKIESESLRYNLAEEIARFLKYLRRYSQAYDKKEKDDYRSKIEKHLKNTSAFTAFKRQIIKDNPQLRQEFGRYFES